jgi:hypothetical protein
MSKYEFLQPKFTEGVLAKSLQGRSIEEFYHYGYKSSKNMIPVLSGPVVKRPGTNYIGDSRDSSSIFVPFFKDQNNTYILELGQVHPTNTTFTLTCTMTGGSATVAATSTSGLIVGLGVSGTGIATGSIIESIITNTSFVVSKVATGSVSAPLTFSGGYLRVWSQDKLLNSKLTVLATYEYTAVFPWTLAELSTLKTTQSGDIIFVTCPTKAPYKIQRTIDTTLTNTSVVAEDDSVWDIVLMDFLDGPYTDINIWDISDVTKRYTLKLTTEPTTSDLVSLSTVEFNTIDNTIVLANHGLQVGQHIRLDGSTAGTTGFGNLRKNTSGETSNDGKKQIKLNGTKSVAGTASDPGTGTAVGTDLFYLDLYVIAVTSTTFQVSAIDGGSLLEFELVQIDNTLPVTTASNASVILKKYVYEPSSTPRELTLYNNDATNTALTNAYFTQNDIGRLIRINPLLEGGSNIGGIKWAWGIIKAVGTTGSLSTNSKITVEFKTEMSNTRNVPETTHLGTSEFRLGAFSLGQGYPHVAQIYQQRMVFATNTFQPSTIWLSETANFFSFAPSVIADQGSPDSVVEGSSVEIVIDSNALTFTLDSDTLDEIKWLAESKKLSIGTSAGVYMLYGSETDLSITPFRFTINKETSFSATDIDPIVVSNAIIYAQIGGKDVQSLILEASTVSQWESSKISLKGYDIIKDSEIVKMVWQERPNTIIWFMMADGRLLSLSYDKGLEFQAWAEHIIGGTEAKVLDIGILPKASHDQIWFKISREIGGNVKYHIETLGRFPTEGALVRNDYVFSDSAVTKSIGGTFTASSSTGLLLTSVDHGLVDTQIIRVTNDLAIPDLPANLEKNTDYYVRDKTDDTFKVALTSGGTAIAYSDAGTPTHSWTTKQINGISHLIDESLQIYNGGMQHVNKTVSAGSTITLNNYESNRVVVGIGYDAEIETLTPSAPENQFSYTKRLIKAAVLIEESLAIQLEYNDLSEELLFRTTQDNMGEQIALFSGIRKLSLSGIGWDTHNIKIVSTGPFPMQLNAVIIEVETGGS